MFESMFLSNKSKKEFLKALVIYILFNWKVILNQTMELFGFEDELDNISFSADTR